MNAGDVAWMLTATGLHTDRFFWDRPQTWLWSGLYGVILPRIAAVYGHAAEALDQPDLVTLLAGGTPCYAATARPGGGARRRRPAFGAMIESTPSLVARGTP